MLPSLGMRQRSFGDLVGGSLLIGCLMLGCGGGGGSGNGGGTDVAQTTQSLGDSVTALSELPLPMISAEDSMKAPEPVVTFSPAKPVVGDVVVLDATATAPAIAGHPMFYVWHIVSQPAGSSASVVHEPGPSTYFVPDVAGVYEVYIAINQDIAPGLLTTTITVEPPAPGESPTPPELPRLLTPLESMTSPEAVAEFSPASPSVGSVVSLDGTRTKLAVPDYPLYFDWQMLSRPSGSSAVIDDRTAGATSFVPDVPGDYLVYFAATQGSSAMVVGSIHVH